MTTVFKFFHLQKNNAKRMAYFNDIKPNSQEQGKCFLTSTSQWNPVLYN